MKNSLTGNSSVLSDIYEPFFALFGDNAWQRLNEGRLKVREAIAATFAKPGSTVIECGTFLGSDTEKLASAVGASGIIHTFDPCPTTQRQRSVALQEIKERHGTAIKEYRIPLYDRHSASVFVAYSPDRPGHTMVHHTEEVVRSSFSSKCEIVNQNSAPLDALNDLSGLTLLWVDSQGASAHILDGARELLTKHRPAIMFEYAQVKEFRLNPSWPKILFEELNYKVYDFTGEVIMKDVDFGHLKCWNIFAFPAEIAMPSEITRGFAQFRSRLTQTLRDFRIVAQEPIRSIEVVSLKTAATVSDGSLYEKPLELPSFDIFKRASNKTPEMLRVAKFDRLAIAAGKCWKPITPEDLFVDELGYSDKEKLKGIQHSWLEFDGRWTVQLSKPLLEPITDRPIFLLGGDGAYYHWLLNWLPRLMVFDEFAGLLGSLKEYQFLISPLLGRACIRSLELLGISRDQLLTPPLEATIYANNVVVPSFFSSNVISPNVGNWFRRKFRSTRTSGTRRIYISRNDLSPVTSQRRRIMNENEMLPVLKKYSFEIVRLAEQTFEDQVSLFSDASIVVGPHGAGFANLVFTPIGAKVLVFENSWNHTFMVDMARTIGHHAESMLGDDIIDRGYESQFESKPELHKEVIRNRDMTVDLSKFESKLAVLCA